MYILLISALICLYFPIEGNRIMQLNRDLCRYLLVTSSQPAARWAASTANTSAHATAECTATEGQATLSYSSDCMLIPLISSSPRAFSAVEVVRRVSGWSRNAPEHSPTSSHMKTGRCVSSFTCFSEVLPEFFA